MSLSYVLSGTKPRSSKKAKGVKHVRHDVSSSSSGSDTGSNFEDLASTYTLSTSNRRSHRPGYKRQKKQLSKSRKPLLEAVDDYRRKPDANIDWECYEESETDEEGKKVKIISWERVDSTGHEYVKKFRITKRRPEAKHRHDSDDDSGLGTSISGTSEDESHVPLPIIKKSRHSSRRYARRHERHGRERHHHPSKSRANGSIHEKSIRIPQEPKTNIVLKAGKNIYMGDCSPEPKKNSDHHSHRRRRKAHRRAMHAAQPHEWSTDLIKRRIVTTKKSWDEPFRWPWSRKNTRENYNEQVYSDHEWEYKAMDHAKGKGIAGRGKGKAPRRPGEFLKSRGNYSVLRAI